MPDLEKYPPGKYFIRRNGGWFRPNASGYCIFLAGAGLYDRDDAVKYLDVVGLTIHHAVDKIADLEGEIKGHLGAMVLCEELILKIKGEIGG